jgi:tetratricopeptide (TPR) repeat protein
MTPRSRCPSLPFLLLAALAAACATPGGDRGSTAAVVNHQADERIPPLSAFRPGDERTLYYQALEHERRGWQAESSGDAAGAREPLEAAARAFLAFLDRFRGTGWDVTLRYHAVDLLRRAQRFDEAIALAEKIVADARSSPKSKAMALLQVANAEVGAGRTEALRIAPAGERKGPPAQPRPMAEPWKRFVEATDAWLGASDPARPEPEDRTLSAGRLALVPARVAFAYDDMESARRRLATILARWPGDHDVFEGAAPLYVQTFLLAGDHEGMLSAAEQVREIARVQSQRATLPEARAAYEKVMTETQRLASGARYERAKVMLEEGKAAEAAEAFEALAKEQGGDQAAALVASAIAWDKAGRADRAAELRRRVLDEHADSRVAPGAALQLAAHLSRKGDHVEAARLYGLHAEKWPDDQGRCTALQNGAVELDLAKRVQEAAERYRAFGTEARCAQASPDVASLALYRAGQLYLAAKKRTEARDAFQAATEIQGVSTPDAKLRVKEARSEATRLGAKAGTRPPPR